MSRNEHNGTYFILGAIIGGIIALLSAPKTGKQTREWLKKTIEDHQDSIDKTKDTAEEMIVKTKHQIENLIDNVSKSIEEKIQKQGDVKNVKESK